MAGQHDGFALGVDLGTSNTVAVLRWPDGRTRPLLVDGQPVIPSGVYADTDGRLHVGRDARRLAQADPGRYEPNPKRRIDAPTVALGDREYAPADLLAAILHAVGQAAVAAVGFLPPAVLTCPASWDDARRQVLADALLRAGWPQAAEHTLSGPTPPGTRLLREPVAAARYYAQVLRRPVPVGGSIAVFDLGGGTLDVAVLRNEGADPWGDSGFTVTATGGVPDLGGLDLDAALVARLGERVSATDPQVWQRLTRPADAPQWRDRHQLWEGVREAREMLSRATVAPVVVPGLPAVVELTREDVEGVAAPLLARAVAETRRVIAAAGLTPDRLAGLFLVGGPTRMPLVARMLHAELGVAPTVLEQPELPVAEGALTDLPTPRPAPASPPAPPGAAPGLPSTVPAPAGTPATAWGGPMPVSPPAPVPPTVPGSPAAPGSPATPGSPSAARRRRALWITVAAVLALAGVGVGAALWFTRDRYPGLEFQNLAEVERVPAGEDRPVETLTALLGDVGYAAYPLPDDRLEIVALDAGTGRTRWRTQTTQTAQQWDALVAVPGAVAAFADPIGVDAPRELVVRDAASGGQRWSRSIGDDDRVIFGRDVAVLVDTTGNRLVGLRMRDGAQVWTEDNPRDSSGNARSAVLPVETAEAAGGPAYADGTPRDPWRGKADRLVQIGADRSARLIDLVEGTVLRSWPAVADLDDPMVARDDRLYVVDDAGAGGYRLLGYDLTRVAEPTVLHSAADDGRRVAALVACGKHRACLLEAPAGDADRAEVVAVAEGEKARRWATPGARELVPVGAHLIVRRQFPEATSTLFDPAGRAVLRDRSGVAVRLDAGNVLVFADPLSGGEANRSVAGLAVGGTGPVELGLAEDVRSESCSWNTSVLLCGAAKDFVLYRFAPTP
ncbi:PQQ-like domain-containing protein [Micromonospora haikouensis]|uniref:PQQ-like domain-containing protein n=1 Tax=Micromonospora haikouensis TaxID=686309 RepID=A0A1C4WEE8_9ACTN|nr:Hsp70 family protein [Micromonospora haikouensis]SCE94568.1 PQQ-like domain-containing protein [Micromonospora haikouensis]